MSGPFLTKVISAWDYRQSDLSAFCVPFEADREQLAESLLFLRKKYACRTGVDTVESGDIVTIRCRSEKTKFNKDNITVNIGKNLYSRELETQLIGLSVGEERNLIADDAAVSVQVLKAERTALPELTDEFVEKTFRDFHTYADLESWYINDQLEDHIKQQAALAADELRHQALEKSEIMVDKGECARARASGEKIVREHWAFNGFPLDQMTDGQAQEILGYSSAQAYIDWFADLSEEDVSYAALGYELLLAEGRAPTEESYRDAIRKMVEEEGVTEEQLKDYTFTAYASQVCSEHYYSVLETYAYQIIKEKLS